MIWHWPLFEGPVQWPDEPGKFGTIRRHDIHTGVDLYTYPGMPVLAVEDGEIVAIEDFTGANADSPWWNETQAVLVEGSSGVVCYGEMAPLKEIKVGAKVKRGACLGCIKRVLKTDKGRPMTMLHLELYEHGTRKTVWWKLGERIPEGLIDPTPFIYPAYVERRRLVIGL